jgi:hypothetical protein
MMANARLIYIKRQEIISKSLRGDPDFAKGCFDPDLALTMTVGITFL